MDKQDDNSTSVSDQNESQSTLEGYQQGEDSSLGNYLIDPVLIRQETRTVQDIVRRINDDRYIMDPDFQRDFVWGTDKQSKFIESILMRIPIPVFYLAEQQDGKLVVVDGLQRLTTLQQFLGNKFALNLEQQLKLHKKKFDALDTLFRNRIEDCNLILYLIEHKIDPSALLDIFERVNSGTPLSRQQMRNAIYNGKATRFLKNEVIEESFIEITGGSLEHKTMRDREMVNRFCAFKLLDLDKYKGDMDIWLSEALQKMNTMPEPELTKLSGEFRNSLLLNQQLFGQHAFRKYNQEKPSKRRKPSKRSVFNASLWDVMSVGLTPFSSTEIESKKIQLKEAFYQLLQNKEFSEAITHSTNQTVKVKARFKHIQDMLHEVFQ